MENFKTKKVFPEIDIIDLNNDEYELITLNRVMDKDRTKYYLSQSLKKINKKDISWEITRFMREGLRAQLFGIGSPDLKHEGVYYFKLDDIQYSAYGKFYIEDGIMFPKYETVLEYLKNEPYYNELKKIYDEKYNPNIISE